ncbi:GntR family transcriptional regulator [Pseudomonas putida]|uniref:GntR family transcriptional regulator n=1 Tax=Pseudomonas putida TaxID=303 RepID=UPI0023644C9A|nr:GntR family transcriptional regulator [Pseudomonas putida]MDD2002091.1 GntR family transcriptional regulator [Pseudomonas putida]
MKEIFTHAMLDHRLPKTAQVYELLRNSIINFQLPPGHIINEKKIGEQLEISRTPLREAMLRLCQESLITIRPNSKTTVSTINLKDVLEGQLIRDVIETRCVQLAARFYDATLDVEFESLFFKKELACKRSDEVEFYLLDEEFHQLLCHASGYSHLWAVLRASKGQLDRARRLAFPIEQHFDEVIQEHREIFQSLQSRDEQRAASAMKTHLGSMFATLELLLQEKPEYFSEVDLSECPRSAPEFLKLVG